MKHIFPRAIVPSELSVVRSKERLQVSCQLLQVPLEGLAGTIPVVSKPLGIQGQLGHPTLLGGLNGKPHETGVGVRLALNKYMDKTDLHMDAQLGYQTISCNAQSGV